MKIAIIRKKYTFHGGAEGFSQSLINHLVKKGHEIHIFAIKWQKDAEIKNLYFHKIPAITFNSFLRDLSFAIYSYNTLKKYRNEFDIIQSHDKTLFQDIYRAGDGCHREWLRQRLKRSSPARKLLTLLNPYHWLILKLEKKIFEEKRYKKIIAISELVKRNILEHYSVDEKDITVIYNGVDLERFHPRNKAIYRNRFRKNLGIDEQEFLILFVGSGFERKGLRFLIEAIERIKKSITLLVVGKGKEKKLKGLIRNQRVIFCGPQKEIETFYAAADVFAFPTIYEPFGNVHLEALASGLPMITTGLSGASEIIKNGKEGFVVSTPEDIDSLKNYIEILVDNKVRKEMSENARGLAEEFSFQRHIKETISLYESIINQKA